MSYDPMKRRVNWDRENIKLTAWLKKREMGFRHPDIAEFDIQERKKRNRKKTK